MQLTFSPHKKKGCTPAPEIQSYNKGIFVNLLLYKLSVTTFLCSSRSSPETPGAPTSVSFEIKVSEMKKSKSFPILLVLVLLIVMYVSVVNARKSYERKNRAQSHHQQKGRSKGRKHAPDPDHFSSSAPAPAPSYGSYEPHKPIFDILSFGAKGDGVSDDSKVNNT